MEGNNQYEAEIYHDVVSVGPPLFDQEILASSEIETNDVGESFSMSSIHDSTDEYGVKMLHVFQLRVKMMFFMNLSLILCLMS